MSETLRLLLFSDVHTNRRACEHIVALSGEADIVLKAAPLGKRFRPSD